MIHRKCQTDTHTRSWSAEEAGRGSEWETSQNPRKSHKNGMAANANADITTATAAAAAAEQWKRRTEKRPNIMAEAEAASAENSNYSDDDDNILLWMQSTTNVSVWVTFLFLRKSCVHGWKSSTVFSFFFFSFIHISIPCHSIHRSFVRLVDGEIGERECAIVVHVNAVAWDPIEIVVAPFQLVHRQWISSLQHSDKSARLQAQASVVRIHSTYTHTHTFVLSLSSFVCSDACLLICLLLSFAYVRFGSRALFPTPQLLHNNDIKFMRQWKWAPENQIFPKN